MAEIVNTISINPYTFEAQAYSSQDESLITSVDVNASFDPTTDIIEYYVYDLNGDILFQNNFNFPGYSLNDNNLVLDPENDLRSVGFDEGQYNTLYNFVSPKLGSSALDTYYVSQISPDRTEIRLDTTDIPNDVVITSSLDFINNINNATGSYYDFYVNFDNNNLLIGVNALLDTSSIDNPTVLIKLYEPLPQEFDINSQCWVVTEIAEPVAYNINIVQTFDLVEENIPLRGPNTNISVQDQIANSTPYSNLNQLNTTNQSQGTGSLQYQLNSMLAQTGVEINVDYSNYDNFIHFSSAQTRLENFYYKLSLLEQYQFSSSLSSGTTTNFYVSSSNIIWQAKIDEIITGFDDYEYYLYYTSGSTSWPKTGNTPPYTNVSTTSVAGQNWFISQSAVAEEYDIQNNNALVNAIPSYLREDTENAQFELFVEMVGQYFDTVFLYTQDITNKYNADNRVNYGVSKDLVADILRDMGIKIYQNNFSSNDLYSALLGFTPSGSLFNLPYTTGSLPTPTGFEYINTYVTASATGSLVPTEDINAEIYKRIYSNLPYLLKKKGTVEGLRALVTLYGIPNTILQVNEFGGQNEIDENDYDLWFNQFNYAFDTQGTQYITSSWEVNGAWGNNVQTLQFRFQTRGIPTNTGYYSQSLWTTNAGAAIRLRYTGSGYTSGSYSGSIPNPYNEYVHLDFIPNTSSLSTSASVYLPFFDGNWWNVMVTAEVAGGDFVLYAGNKTTPGGNYNTYQFLSSSSVNGDSSPWENGQKSLFPSTANASIGKMFSGSYQEIRYYNEILTVDPFEDYIMYPYSIDANGINTAPNTLLFRATLGSELYTSSISIHPKITGSWVTTQSFSSNTSNFYLSSTNVFVPNREFVYPNQFPSGIKNRVSNKIRQQNEVLPYSGSNEVNLPQNIALSPFISVQQEVPESGSYTPNIDYVEVAFSPQNEINNDIAGQLGYFNIGEYIGDPRLVSSSAESYPALDALRDYYFEKYTSNYNFWDYIRLIKYFDNSLFKMIQDWVPARTNLASGIVIKQTTLERNKYPVPQLDLSSSLAMVDSNATSSVILFQGNEEAPVCFPITSSGVYNLYVTGSISNSGGDDPTLFDIYITSSNGIFSLFSQDIDDGSTVPFSGSYNANIPSGSSLCFVPDSNANAYYLNNVTASLLVANTSTYPYTTQDMLITGSPIQMYEISGSTGGTMPDLFGLTQSFYTGNNVVNITQSWTGSTPSLLGPVAFIDSTQAEFYNGELSGSSLQVENGELNEDNPYKLAPTQILFYNTIGVNPGTTTPGAGNINYTYAIGYNGSNYYLYVNNIYINETSNNGVNIQTALSNLQAGNQITFTVFFDVNGIDYTSTVTGTIASIGATSATTYGLSFIGGTNSTTTIFTPYTLGETVTLDDISNNNIIISPFLNISSNFDNSAFNPVINNAVISRPNFEFFDVDFSSNAIVAVNKNSIISASRGSGSATPSSVPASNYTTKRISNPRYDGCENTSPNINIGSGNNLPVVEQLGKFAFSYKGAGKSDNLVPNDTTFFNITVGVDEDGNLYQPQSSSIYYWNSENLFGKDEIIQVLVQNSASVSQTTLTSLQGEKTVFSLFEYPNSYLTTTSASGYNIFDYPNIQTGSITLVDTVNQVAALVNAPYWATSSATPFSITSSTGAGKLGFYLNEALSGSTPWTQQDTPNRQGLSAPLDNIAPQVGDIFYHPNFVNFFTVTDVSVGGGEFVVTFDKPITAPSDTAAELNKFIFIRNYENLNKITLNISISGSNPQVGSGLIFPQKKTQTFTNNLSDITSNLISKNLL